MYVFFRVKLFLEITQHRSYCPYPIPILFFQHHRNGNYFSAQRYIVLPYSFSLYCLRQQTLCQKIIAITLLHSSNYFLHTTNMARKTKEEAEATRNSLLDAAEKLFSEQGVASTTLLQVATEAGLSRGAIYWHFKGKDDLFQALMRRVTDPLQADMARTAIENKKTPLLSLWNLLTQALEATVHNPQAQRIFEISYCKMEYVERNEAARLLHHQARARFLRICHAALAHAEKMQNTTLTVEKEQAAIAIHSMFDGLLYNWFMCPKEERFDLIKSGKCAFSSYLKGLGIDTSQLT